MKERLLLICITLASVYSSAQPCPSGNTWLGITSDWFNPSNWCTGAIPTATTDAIISTGTPSQPVINSAGAVCRGINISSGASLTINGTNILSVLGDWTNNGTLIANSSTVSFTANTSITQTVTGSTNFYNISKPNANSTLSFGNSTTTIGNNLSVSAGSMSGGTSTIIFTGSAASLQGNSTKDFYNLEIGSGAALTQTAGTNVNINNSYKNNGTFIQTSNRTITFQNASQTLSGSGVSNFGNVTVAGAITLNAGTHDFSVLGTFNLPVASGIFNGGTAKTTFAGSSAAMGQGPGAINFNNVTISGTLSNVNKNFSITGNWLNNGSYNPGNETITFSGGSQTIGGNSSTVFNNLNIAGTADKVLSNDITINNSLTLLNRNIDARANSKIVYAKGTITRNITGHIIGELRKDFPAGSNITRLFEVGTTAYAPVTVNFPVVTTAGIFTASTDNGDHENINASTLDPNKSLNRHWTLGNTGIDPGIYDVTFEFIAAEVDNGANTNNFRIGKYGSGIWTYPVTVNVDASHIKATGVNGFSDFAVAEPACMSPSISVQPLAMQSICQNHAPVDLLVIASGDGLAYQWYVDDGNIGFDGNAIGVNTNSFTPPASSAGNFYYYCIVTGLCGTITSNYATVSIDPLITWYRDADGDGFGDIASSTQACTAQPGYVSNNSDCNDDDNAVYPNATETCDGKDNDCDGVIDENVQTIFYRDADGDGFGDIANSMQACTTPPGYVSNNADCNDNDNTVYPNATESCDGKDNDCNGAIDENIKTTFYRDADGDGAGDIANSIQSCTALPGYVSDNTDCNDDDNSVYPGATETCDGKDNDCNGAIDENIKTTFYRDADGDGAGDIANSIQSCTALPGYVSDNTDCNDDDNSVYPGATETCDGKDNDCNGAIDEDVKTIFYRDADGDGFGNIANSTQACTVPPGYATNSTDCDDDDPSVYPAAAEICDEKDNDCNGSIDDNTEIVTFYRDADGDGYGNTSGPGVQSCIAPEGFVNNNDDCDDVNAAVRPGANEVCDGKDNNCDGRIDEGVKTIFYRDADGDGYGNPAIFTEACVLPADYVTNNSDCNDATANVYPGASELCDGLDNNCDGQVDEIGSITFYRDADGDGYGNPSVTVKACIKPTGYVINNSDCNDANRKIHPGASEICGNGIDENCNGQTDDGCITTIKVCAYAQSSYDNNAIGCVPNGISTSGQIMLNSVDAQPGDSVIFGSKTSGKFFTLKKSDIQNGYVYKLLPGVGASRALKGYCTYTRTATWSNVPMSNSGSIQNELLAQTMTLFFNLQLSSQLGSLPLNTNLNIRRLTLCVIQGNLLQVKITAKAAVASCLQTKYGSQGITVANLYKLANELLGNTNACNLVYAEVNDAVKNVNEIFNGCVLVSLPGSANNNQTITVAKPEIDITGTTDGGDVRELKVTTSPNPFRHNIRFDVVSPETGKVKILVYDASGIKRGELEQDVIKNIPATIWFRNEQLRQGILFYRVSINNIITTGNIMQVN